MNPNRHAKQQSADPEYFMAMLSLFIGKIKHRRKGDNMTQLHTSNKCSKKVKRHKQVLNSYPDIIIKSIKIHLKQENICQRNTSVGAIDTGLPLGNSDTVCFI